MLVRSRVPERCGGEVWGDQPGLQGGVVVVVLAGLVDAGVSVESIELVPGEVPDPGGQAQGVVGVIAGLVAHSGLGRCGEGVGPDSGSGRECPGVAGYELPRPGELDCL
jgi:hypothetical protein